MDQNRTHIGNQPLLDRAGEHALALEIEARSRALWTLLLANPITAELVAERLPEVKLRGRGVQRRSRELHAADVDHRVADELVARITDPRIERAAHALADVRNRFVQANLGLVYHVAQRYRSTALSHADLAQEGMFGLIKAVDRFDPRRGLRFSTYAVWWIRHAIGRALADRGRLVRLPVHLLETRQRLGTLERTLQRQLGRAPTREELADAAGLTTDKLDQVRQATVGAELSLDAPAGEGSDRSRADIFLDPTETWTTPEESLHQEAMAGELRRQLLFLSPIEREVLERRFALAGTDEETLREIAADHGLSRERIRQIESNALRKLRTRLARLEAEPVAHAA